MGYYKGEKMRTWVTHKREIKIAEKYTNEGYKFLNMGFPDFLFYKDLPNGKVEGFFVEVKKKPIEGKKTCKSDFATLLTAEQTEYNRVLNGMGIDARVIYQE